MSIDIATALPHVTVLTPADGDAYSGQLKRWCDNAERKAKFVILPKSPEEVSQAILFATTNNLEIAIKGGGHSTSGSSSSDDLVIDLARLNSVSVKVEEKLIVVGGGALWGDVNEAAAKYGLATISGAVDHTGVGGLTLGGGYGWLSGKYGLSIDMLVEAQVVLASGQIVTCSEKENSDLFWAIRGAGSNFGPVTSFTFRLFEQKDKLWSGLLIFPPPALEVIVTAADTWAKSASAEESSMVIMACPPPAFQPAIAVMPVYNGPADAGKKAFSAYYAVTPVADLTQEVSYPDLNRLQNPMATYGDRKAFKAAVLTSLVPARLCHLFDEFSKLVTELPETAGSAVLVELIPYNKIVSVPTTATAFGNRGKWYNINFSMRWKNPELDSRIRAWATEQVNWIRAQEEKDVGASLAGKQAYGNYGLGDERARDVFGENYERLSELKAKYDPQNAFHKWFPITPKA